MQNCIAPPPLADRSWTGPVRHGTRLALLLLAVPLAAHADGKIYRCTDHGKTVFQDGPCEVKPGFWPPFVAPQGTPGAANQDPAAPRPSAAPGSPAPLGDWRGQTQYQGTENGQYLQGSQSVVPLVISLSQDGKVTGTSSENGCHVLGIWGPGIAPNIAALDVTLNGCSYPGFNRRYSGFLSGAQNQQSAQLSLQAYDTGIGKVARLYDVKSSMRR